MDLQLVPVNTRAYVVLPGIVTIYRTGLRYLDSRPFPVWMLGVVVHKLMMRSVKVYAFAVIILSKSLSDRRHFI